MRGKATANPGSGQSGISLQLTNPRWNRGLRTAEQLEHAEGPIWKLLSKYMGIDNK